MLPPTDYERQIRGINRIRDKVINATSRIVCYNQLIYNDARVEPPEYIGLQLAVRDATVVTQVLPIYSNATILIVDSDDCMLHILETSVIFSVLHNHGRYIYEAIDAVSVCMKMTKEKIVYPIVELLHYSFLFELYSLTDKLFNSCAIILLSVFLEARYRASKASVAHKKELFK